jgi:hypothetical protein
MTRRVSFRMSFHVSYLIVLPQIFGAQLEPPISLVISPPRCWQYSSNFPRSPFRFYGVSHLYELTSSSVMLDLLFNHIVLPPRLPGKEDGRIEDIEHGLITRVLLASRTVRDLVDISFRDRWDSIRRSLQACKAVNLGGKLDKKSLLTELRCLQSEDILILHIAQQNAGLLIRRHHE